ncbi:MAG: helix-turn-helix domain-containing protein [Planctomycetes bacterium]|nr:helix-turn-helix domain-containing protein [Planctomycetota bacterium]
MAAAMQELQNRLAISAAELAERLSCSERHIWTLHSSGRLPRPIAIGRCRRWRVADIETWLADGCPTRDTMEGGRR